MKAMRFNEAIDGWKRDLMFFSHAKGLFKSQCLNVPWPFLHATGALLLWGVVVIYVFFKVHGEGWTE